ncbi:MAG: PduL/EutD family phosphate acyltransferase [Bacilli bacterium]|nr:PduL/EutD family phosphate acyltransferase [Bacilli bacterium]
MKIPLGVSKRHIHLTKEVYQKLFNDKSFEVRNYLKQPGEFASTDTVDIKWNNKVLERVRIVGPFRNYNQVEVSRRDAEYLGIKPVIRKSGEIKESHPIILCGPDAEVLIDEGLIVAKRHIHIDSMSALNNDLKEGDSIYISKDEIKLFDAYVKVIDPSFIELHIDDEEAELYKLSQGDIIEVSKV